MGILAVVGGYTPAEEERVSQAETDAAVADSQHNVQLIKKAARLSLVDSRAGLLSFELPCTESPPAQ